MTVYYRVLKQAYWILRTHKFLWIFGLFLFWGNLGNVLNFSVEPTSRRMQVVDSIGSWITANTVLASVVMVVLIFLCLLFVGLYVRARAGLILSVKNITDKQSFSFIKGFKEGKLYFRRIFTLVVYVSLFNLLLLLVLLAPVVYMSSIGYVFRAVVLSFLGAIVYLPLYFGSVFLLSLAPCFIVLYNMNLKPAVLSSLDLIREYWSSLLFFVLVLFLISTAVLFGVIAISAAIMAPFVFLARLVYHTDGSQLSMISTSIGIVAAASVFLIAHAALAAYHQTSWVLYYLELVKPPQAPETEAEVVPEIVS